MPVHDELLANLFVIDNTFISWIARHVVFAMCVRVAVLSPFESQPEQEGFFRRAWYDVLHDITHLKLNTQRMYRSDDISVISDPRATEAATLSGIV